MGLPGKKKHIYWPGSGKHVPTGMGIKKRKHNKAHGRKHNNVSISRTSTLHSLHDFTWEEDARYIRIHGSNILIRSEAIFCQNILTLCIHCSYRYCTPSSTVLTGDIPRSSPSIRDLPLWAYVGPSYHTKKGPAVTDWCGCLTNFTPVYALYKGTYWHDTSVWACPDRNLLRQSYDGHLRERFQCKASKANSLLMSNSPWGTQY